MINFSIGSPDFTDVAFDDKVTTIFVIVYIKKIKEVVNNGITIITAAGNDGPFLGYIENNII